MVWVPPALSHDPELPCDSSYTHTQKCLHWCFPGKKSPLLCSVTWKRGRQSRHGVWKKGGEKAVVFGGNSDLMSLESQTNSGEKKNTLGKIWTLSLGCAAWLEMGRHLKFGDQRETCPSEALVQSKLKEKRRKVGKYKMTCEHQARDSTGPELGQACRERTGICFLWLWNPRAGSLKIQF